MFKSIIRNPARRRWLFRGGGILEPILENLVSWHDADYAAGLWQDSARTTPATANSDPVGAMDDRSGNNRHVTQATGANRFVLATNALNGKNVVLSPAANTFLKNGSYPDFGDNYTVYAVAKWDATAAVNRFVMEVYASSFGDGFAMLYSAPNFFRGRDSVSSKNVTTATNLRDGVWRVLMGLNTGTQLEASLNATALTPVAYTAPNPNTLSVLTIGGEDFAVSGLIGAIAEILIYSVTHTLAQQLAMRTYLNTKWGVF